MFALTLDDFDKVNKTVKIFKTLTRIERRDIVSEPKTPRSNRIINLPDFLFEKLEEYLTHLYDYKSSERLFTITKHYLLKEMMRGCLKSDIKRIRVHDLRHSHASLLIELGFPAILIRNRLGHEDIETTLNTYSHLYPNKHEEVADKLNEIKNGITVDKNNR